MKQRPWNRKHFDIKWHRAVLHRWNLYILEVDTKAELDSIAISDFGTPQVPSTHPVKDMSLRILQMTSTSFPQIK